MPLLAFVGVSEEFDSLLYEVVKYFLDCIPWEPLHMRWCSLPTAREGNVFTGVCLSTIGLTASGLLTARSVRILLECFLVSFVILR